MEICRLSSAFRGCIQSIELRSREEIVDPEIFLNDSYSTVKELMSEWVSEFGAYKHQLSLKVNLEKLDGSEMVRHFNTKQKILMASSNFDSVLDEACVYILSKIDGFQQKGSGWIVKNVDHLVVHVARYQPLRGIYICAFAKIYSWQKSGYQYQK